MVITVFDSIYFVFFFYNLDLECDNAYELGKTQLVHSLVLKSAVISVRLDSFLREESFGEQAPFAMAVGSVAAGTEHGSCRLFTCCRR